LLDYGNETEAKMVKQPSPEVSMSASIHNRSSVFTQNEIPKSRRNDIFEALEGLNLDIMDEKDRENLK